MQAEAPEAVDLKREPASTLEMYGVGRSPTDEFGRNCLIARRLVERGVRFVQLYSGGGHLEDTWDAHESVAKNHGQHAAEVDQPIAALLTDLAQRGLLESTLVVWGGEFGRMPFSEGQGRAGPKPQSVRFHDVDGRRRRAGRGVPTARRTTSVSRRSRTKRTSTTCTRRSFGSSGSTTAC
jgi:hypothetical protein